MTLKEEAAQLVNRFYLSLPNNGSFSGLNNINIRWEEGKNCALIAIDEMINLYNEMNENGLLKPNSIGFNLSELKQEIENL